MSYTVTTPSLPLNLNSSLTCLKTDLEGGQVHFLEPSNPPFKWRLLIAYDGIRYSGIRHGDIRPENVICVTSGANYHYFVLIGWGHAVMEERDRPAMNLHFSSAFALQERKLCSASDAESLVYMLYFCSGGELPDLDSVEGALQWRERAWSRRLIQQTLGDISAVLKAFADYVDSLCGTPYPINYDIWLRRLKKHMRDDDHGKGIDMS